MMQMDRVPKQDLHMACPKHIWVLFHHRSQVAYLVCHAKLMFFGRRLHLGTITITDPDFSLVLIHHLLNHIHAAVEAHNMQNSRERAEHPLPPILAIHAATRFIGMDHCALPNSLLDRLGCANCLLPGALHDLIDPALTDGDPMQIAQGCYGPNIAHMLFLPIVDHGRFQPRSKAALHFQSNPRSCHLVSTTTRTLSRILAYLDQFVSAHLSYFVTGHPDPILPNLLPCLIGRE